MEGRLLETILKAKRGVASCGRGSYPRAGEVRDTARQARRPGCEELAARIRRQCRRWKRGPRPKNRHGGAPRGERPASWDAPRLTRADPSRLANATNEIVRLSALRPPLFGSDANG